MFTLHWHENGRPANDDVYGHSTTARRQATELSRGTRAVEVRAAGKVRYVVQPDGRVTPPKTAKVPEREQCKRESGQACFCSVCRAERAEARRRPA